MAPMAPIGPSGPGPIGNWKRDEAFKGTSATFFMFECCDTAAVFPAGGEAGAVI